MHERCFIDTIATYPVICTLIVTLLHDDLGCQVKWSTTECVGLILDNLSKAKVHDDGVPITVKKNIFRLQITVNNMAKPEERKIW